jgi:glutaredoxin
MKEITYFYLNGCPYCHQADKLISELISENPEFAGININKIEESRNSALANSYDYYYVPCLWIEKTKLMEGVPSKEKIRSVFNKALEK